MPKYDWPVKLHRFTTEEFDRKRAEYVAKYGYTMHIPGFTDIIKFDLGKPPTDLEVKQYKAKDITALGQSRYNDIQKLMAKKRESFLRMMASPTPTWINNIGTTMTFMDDVNDAAGTLSMVCRIGAHLLPKALGKFLMGPAGWALTAADIAQVANTLMQSPLTTLTRKSDLSKASATNPFCKEARVSRSRRLKRIKPTKGEIIEALQVTKNVFGVGLCLGPLVGAFVEAFTGPFRVLSGKTVRVKWPIPDLTNTEITAMKGVYGAYMLNTGGQELSPEDHMKTYAVANMATQILYPLFEQYHPLDQIDGIQHILPTPPSVTDPLTKLLFEEEGIDHTQRVGFLHANHNPTSVSDLMDIGFELNPASFDEFATLNKHTYTGLIGSQSVNDFAQNSLALLEGEDVVELDYHPVEKACFKIMDNAWRFHDQTTTEQLECFALKVQEWDDQGYDFAWRDLKPRLVEQCGITFAPALKP
jgi:hypothetical protein